MIGDLVKKNLGDISRELPPDFIIQNTCNRSTYTSVKILFINKGRRMGFGEMTSTLEPSSGQSDHHVSAVPLIGSEWTYIQVRPIGTTDMKLNQRVATLFLMDLNVRGCGE